MENEDLTERLTNNVEKSFLQRSFGGYPRVSSAGFRLVLGERENCGRDRAPGRRTGVGEGRGSVSIDPTVRDKARETGERRPEERLDLCWCCSPGDGGL
jgi:hypothetical protein